MKQLDPSNLLKNLARLHSTPLGIKRITKNLSLDDENVVEWCKNKIKNPDALIQNKGKNWYINIDRVVITVNITSFTIITAHKDAKK